MGRVRTDREVRAFLALLRAGLWDHAPEGFPSLSAQEWTLVRRLAKEQTVSGVVFKGLSGLPEGKLPPDILLMQWLSETEATVQRNRRMVLAQQSLLDFFAIGGLDPVVQKGLSAAAFYPSPELRESGDIDLFFPTGWAAALDTLRLRGVVYEYESDGSVLYLWEGVPVEHHPKFLDISSPFKRRTARNLEARFGTGSPVMTLLLLSSHILKHCLGRGVGLRQFCDFALAWKALACPPEEGSGKGGEEASRVREQYFEACAELGLRKWGALLGDFVSEVLSPEADDAPGEISPRVGRLLGLVLEGGNFGMYRKEAYSQIEESAESPGSDNGRGAFGFKEASAEPSGPARAAGSKGSKRTIDCRPATKSSKLLTLVAFARNFRFGMQVAPMEYFGTVMGLLAGQLRPSRDRRTVGKRETEELG